MTNPVSIVTSFQQNINGYYYQTNMYSSGVKNTTGDFVFYSFNKKGKTAHFYTTNAHGSLSLDKANVKFFSGIAKQNNIPCLEGMELSLKQTDIEENLKHHYNLLNDSVKQVRILERQKFVADSLRKVELDSIKAVQDSIEQARKDSLQRIADKHYLDSLTNVLDSIKNLMKIEYDRINRMNRINRLSPLWHYSNRLLPLLVAAQGHQSIYPILPIYPIPARRHLTRISLIERIR